MLKLRESSVVGKNKLYLDDQQSLIDQQADYAAQVEKAKYLWEHKNPSIFAELRKVLESLCSGARRCHYCEDSAADEVEHVWPKNFYPNKTFRWTNYLFACGPCNGTHKGDQFAVFDNAGRVIEIVRRKADPVVLPASGEPVFLDPHLENPMDYMELDPSTGLFIPIGNKGDANYIRAEYTIRILGLNKRDYLSSARRSAYASYLNSASYYVARKSENAPADELTRRRSELGDGHHPSVWVEIKRLAQTNLEHQQIFKDAPELWFI